MALVVGHKGPSAPQRGLSALCLSSGISVFAVFSVIMSGVGEQAEGA